MTNLSLLDTENFRNILSQNIKNCQNEITIYSPFIKMSALTWLAEKNQQNVNIKLISRLKVKDIIDKSSDFEICSFALDKNWKIGLIHNLHAKVYIFDNKNILIGSNNLTSNGLGLNKKSNLELGTLFSPDLKSFDLLKNLTNDIMWLDKKKIILMEDYLKNFDTNLSQSLEDFNWPNDLYKPKSKYLLLSSNFPDISPMEHKSGRKTFFIDDHIDENNTKFNFINSEVYLWVKSILTERGFKNFGWLTSKIHNSILDNPLPYRSKIKSYCKNLFMWIETYSDEIKIVKHNKTKSLEFIT